MKTYKIYRVTDRQGLVHYVQTALDMSEMRTEVSRVHTLEKVALSLLSARVQTITRVVHTTTYTLLYNRGGEYIEVVPDDMLAITDGKYKYYISSDIRYRRQQGQQARTRWQGKQYIREFKETPETIRQVVYTITGRKGY